MESFVGLFSSLLLWIWARHKKFIIQYFFQDKGFVLTPYPLHYSNYDDASNEMRTCNKWFTDCKKEYIYKVILGRLLSKLILILMSCLVLEGNMILISGVSGASPTSLLSVNFLFGSWPDNEFTLPGETSAVSWQYPDLLKSIQSDCKRSWATQKNPEWQGVYTV